MTSHLRNLNFERDATRHAALAQGVDTTAIVHFAEHRAGQTRPVTDLLDRDFGMEGMEEAADHRNYLVWHLQQLEETAPIDESDELQCARLLLQQALGHACAAFVAHAHARAILLDSDPDEPLEHDDEAAA